MDEQFTSPSKTVCSRHRVTFHDDWLNLFGPELAYVADAAGQYNSVTPARPGRKFATLLEVLQNNMAVPLRAARAARADVCPPDVPQYRGVQRARITLISGQKWAPPPYGSGWWRLFLLCAGASVLKKWMASI